MWNLQSQRTTFGTSLTLAGSVACCESHGTVRTPHCGVFFSDHSVSARALPLSGHHCYSGSTHLWPDFWHLLVIAIEIFQLRKLQYSCILSTDGFSDTCQLLPSWSFLYLRSRPYSDRWIALLHLPLLFFLLITASLLPTSLIAT